MKAIVSFDDIVTAVEKVSLIIEEVSQALWQLSEPSLQEIKSSEYLKKLLTTNGFRLTGEGTAGVPTAFVAEYGSGKPVLGVMLEYDALPDLANEAVPYKQPRKDGVTIGHGCGHNLIGAGGIGTALALQMLMERNQLEGTLRVYGAAAEETEGAKAYMARDGLFTDVDSMLHWHPKDVAAVMNIRSAAMSRMYIEFSGKTAHAGMAPWEGRSALHAAEIFLHSVNVMREHVRPTARLHYMIKNGGSAPNIVPEKASVLMMVRDESRTLVEQHISWIKDMATGAALATQTKSLAVDYYGHYDILPNTPLAERMQQHLEKMGLPEYTEEEISFATSLQTEVGIDPAGMTKNIMPLSHEITVGGGSDVGDVSWITPTMGVLMPASPEGIGLHTWMATASHGTSIGTKGAIAAAQLLTLTGIDILTDPEFLLNVKNDFEKRTKGFEFKPAINGQIKEPVGLPEDMRAYGSLLNLKEKFYNQIEEHPFKKK